MEYKFLIINEFSEEFLKPWSASWKLRSSWISAKHFRTKNAHEKDQWRTGWNHGERLHWIIRNIKLPSSYQDEAVTCEIITLAEASTAFKVDLIPIFSSASQFYDRGSAVWEEFLKGLELKDEEKLIDENEGVWKSREIAVKSPSKDKKSRTTHRWVSK